MHTDIIYWKLLVDIKVLTEKLDATDTYIITRNIEVRFTLTWVEIKCYVQLFCVQYNLPTGVGWYQLVLQIRKIWFLLSNGYYVNLV